MFTLKKVVYIKGYKPAEYVCTYTDSKGYQRVRVVWSNNEYRGHFQEGDFPLSMCEIVRAKGAFRRWWKRMYPDAEIPRKKRKRNN